MSYLQKKWSRTYNDTLQGQWRYLGVDHERYSFDAVVGGLMNLRSLVDGFSIIMHLPNLFMVQIHDHVGEPWEGDIIILVEAE